MTSESGDEASHNSFIDYITQKVKAYEEHEMQKGFLEDIEEARKDLMELTDEIERVKNRTDSLNHACLLHSLQLQLETSHHYLMKMCEVYQALFGKHPYDGEIQPDEKYGF